MHRRTLVPLASLTLALAGAALAAPAAQAQTITVCKDGSRTSADPRYCMNHGGVSRDAATSAKRPAQYGYESGQPGTRRPGNRKYQSGQYQGRQPDERRYYEDGGEVGREQGAARARPKQHGRHDNGKHVGQQRRDDDRAGRPDRDQH